MRLALVLAGIVVAVGAVIAAIDRVVDPKDEFYSGAALTAALESNCLLADDVVRSRSYPEFKRDLFDRRHAKTVVFDSSAAMQRGVNLGFPASARRRCSTRCRLLARAAPKRRRLNVYVVTNVSWFDPAGRRTATSKTSFAERSRYLLSPWTFASSLDLMRRSRTLAFTGWEKRARRRACVVDRGEPSPAWHADGTLAGATAASHLDGAGELRVEPAHLPRRGARDRPRTHHWRVVGLSGLTPRWETYERELKALFAKHGYRWRIRRMQA